MRKLTPDVCSTPSTVSVCPVVAGRNLTIEEYLMSKTKFRALAGTSTLVLSLGTAIAANAQSVNPPTLPATSTVVIYGAGSTLVQPYIRQAEDCFGTREPTWDKSAPPVGTVEPYYNFTGTPAQNCATTHPDHAVVLQYQGVGSGGGILGVFTHNPQNFASVGNYTASGATSGSYWPTAHYGASDLPLSSADVDVYNNGGTLIPTPNKATNIAGSNNPSGTVANPLVNYGPLVQYPLLIAPVTVAYSPIYKEVFNTNTNAITAYKFHLPITHVTVGGKSVAVYYLKLSSQVYCQIFNGYITDWNDSRIGALNSYKAPTGGITVGGVTYNAGDTVTTLEDPNDPTAAADFSVPIELVGRSDSSGTTGIFTRHMQAECSNALPQGEANNFVAGSTLAAGQIRGSGTGGPGSGLFTVENGSGAVAAYTQFIKPTASNTTSISGRIAYLGPDYVTPYSPTSTGLYPAALQNNFDSTNKGVNVYVLPSPTSAVRAFGAALPPETDSHGGYVPATGSAPRRNQPYAWVEALSPTVPLATAGDTLSGAYPITGTSNVLAYTCYADKKAGSVNNVGVQLNQFLTWYSAQGTVTSTSSTSPGILAARGFGDLPTAWRLAVRLTFLAPTTASSGGYPATNALQLWISSKSDVGTSFIHNPVCDTVPGA
jgi:ABC-type phosphate transport system substrate-binding protein